MSSLTESQIRLIAKQAVEQLGAHATVDNIEKVVHEAVQRINGPTIETNEPKPTPMPHQAKKGDRVIVTAFGSNKIGILAGLTGCLASTKCDVLDMSQKILQEFFTIMLLVDISQSSLQFDSIKEKLIEAGAEFDLKVIVQHEQIFKTMHRV